MAAGQYLIPGGGWVDDQVAAGDVLVPGEGWVSLSGAPRLISAAQTIPAFGQAARLGFEIVSDTDIPASGRIVLVEIDLWES